jgi:ankyrin repeat protein
MFRACSNGDLEVVRRLVAKDPTLVRAHYEYRTPLSFAVRENKLAVAEYLLDHGAARSTLGDPLGMARDRGYVEMIRLLERKLGDLGASADGEAVATAIRAHDLPEVRRLLDATPRLVLAGDRRGNQPIHWAVMTRQIEMIDELLGRDADIDARRLDGARPIHLTNGDYAFRGWRDVPPDWTTTPDQVYRHLVARGANVDIWMAAGKGDLARVRHLLDEDPSLVNRNNEYNSYYAGCGSPLKNAAAAGHIDVVQLLLDRGADPNLPQEEIAPRGGALYAAVYHDHYAIASLLLAHGANPDQPVESSADPVWIAIRNGNARMLELLAAHGAVWRIPIALTGSLDYAAIAATGLRRPLEILAYYGDIAAAAPLLESDPSLADDPEALESAAGERHVEFVRLLLRHRPETARRVTVSRPRELAELLFAHGMDPNRPNWMGVTPLHRFAREGDIESASLFLDHGANLEAEDGELRSTPLAWAAEAGQARMVEFLLRRGAKASPASGEPWATPFAWATRRGHGEIATQIAEFERTGKLPERTLADFEAVAGDLVRAYDGDEPALMRIARYFHAERALTWDDPPLAERVKRLRGFVRDRLGEDAPGLEEGLALPLARLLVARSEGHASWEELASRAR